MPSKLIRQLTESAIVPASVEEEEAYQLCREFKEKYGDPGTLEAHHRFSEFCEEKFASVDWRCERGRV